MSTKIVTQEVKSETYHECCGSELKWWKISPTFHGTESPHWFGKVEGKYVVFQDYEVSQLLSDPAAYGLSESDVALLNAA